MAKSWVFELRHGNYWEGKKKVRDPNEQLYPSGMTDIRYALKDGKGEYANFTDASFVGKIQAATIFIEYADALKTCEFMRNETDPSIRVALVLGPMWN